MDIHEREGQTQMMLAWLRAAHLFQYLLAFNQYIKAYLEECINVINVV